MDDGRPWLMGKVAAVISDILPAKSIVDNMVEEAIRLLENGNRLVKYKL